MITLLVVLGGLGLAVGLEYFYQSRLAGMVPVWRRLFLLGASALTLVALGTVVAKWRQMQVAHPVIAQETGPLRVEGVLETIEQRASDIRLTIRVENIQNIANDALPKKVRVTWRGGYSPMQPGMYIRIRTIIGPPPEPIMAGGFDYARTLYFQEIGATGYAVSRPVVRVRDNADMGLWLEHFRDRLSARIIAGGDQSPDAARIAAALVTGQRAQVPERAVTPLRDAGLAHLIAISGLHMGLVSGFVFFLSRGLMALVPSLALNFPIKKWAAMVTIVSLLFYLALSGASWSAQRAFIMSALVFGAIMLDRRALTLRMVAVAATLILLLSPEALSEIGFQLSFAAVTVLIAVYEQWQKRRAVVGIAKGPVQRVFGFMGGIAITSLLAGLATAPYALYHFNRFVSYGLLGNVLAMPIVALLVMPSGLLGMVLYPLGLDQPAWWMMSKGVGWVLHISDWVSGLEGAVHLMPAMSRLALVSVTLGGLVLIIHQSALRWVGLGLIVVAVLNWFAPQPDLLFPPQLRNFAVRIETDEGERLALWSRRRQRFAAENWLRSAGLSPIIRDAPRIGERKGLTPPCETLSGCSLTATHGVNIQIIESRDQLEGACAKKSQLIISLVAIEGTLYKEQAPVCEALIIDPVMIAEKGAASARFVGLRGEGEGLALEWRDNAYIRGHRPWTVSHSP